jgi:hypothetical protein
MLEKINDYFPVYAKPELSEHTSVINEPIQEKKEDEVEQGVVVTTHRKLSHSEFYERSPESKHSGSDKEEEEPSPKMGRARSEEGDREVDLSTTDKSEEARKAEKLIG